MAEKAVQERAALIKSEVYFTERKNAVRAEIGQFEARLRKSREKLVSASQAGTLKRIFLGLDPRKVQVEIDKLNAAVVSKKQYAAENEQRQLENKSKLAKKKLI